MCRFKAKGEKHAVVKDKSVRVEPANFKQIQDFCDYFCTENRCALLCAVRHKVLSTASCKVCAKWRARATLTR